MTRTRRALRWSAGLKSLSPRRQTILVRLLFWTGGLTALILMVVIGWNYFAMLGRLDQEAQRRAAALAEASADKIDAQLGLLQGVVRGMALVLESSGLKIPFEQARTLQQQALKDHTQLFGLALAFLPGQAPAGWPAAAPYAYRGPVGVAMEDLAAREQPYTGEDWFSLPRYLDEGIWSEPYLRSTGTKIVAYSVPLHVAKPEGARFVGVVRAEIEVGWLDRLIATLPAGTQGYGALITRTGRFVAHPRTQLVFNETFFSVAEAKGDPGLRALGQRMISGQPGLVSWVSWTDAEPSWLAWHPLGTVGWIMGTVVSKAELREEILRFSRQEALVGAMGLGLLLLAVWLVARSITRPIGALGAAAVTLAEGDLEATLPLPQGRDEVAQLTAAFARMRDHLRHYIADLAETTAARERLNSELRVAHAIQMDLVPKVFPLFPDRPKRGLFAVMEPARAVGGDFYDFFMLDDDRLVLAIGDVSGKGIPAALFMAVTRGFLRSALRVDSDPGRALTRINDDLAEGNDSCMFVTVFCAVLSLSEGTVAYANAGHNPPLLLAPDGELRWVNRPYGIAAGAYGGTDYPTGHLALTPGATFLLYTDGVTEAMDPAQRLFGTERLAERLLRAPELDCRTMLEAILSDLRTHAADAEQSDDITMLMFRF